MTELKPCPFCGGEAEVTPIAWNIIQCTRCTCQLIVLPIPEGATEEYAIEAWNRRANDA
jgi:Lar family restriction alleviation protein